MNRQYGLGNFKYVVILDPVLTGHVTRSMRSELLAFNMANATLRLYISVTVQDRRMVSVDHQWETTYAESNGHVTDDIT